MILIRRIIASGYLLMTLLIVCIAYTWHKEWQEVENLESNNRQIDEFRKEINDIHILPQKISALNNALIYCNLV